MKKVEIYTDGSCSGNPGPGGWAAILIYGKKQKFVSGGDANTTNNKMELMAAIKGLEALKESCYVDLYTDSNYLKDGVTKWLNGWKENKWRTSTKKSLKNVDLWQQLDQIIIKHDIHWHWIKAHSDNKLNNQVDALAVEARNKMMSIKE